MEEIWKELVRLVHQIAIFAPKAVVSLLVFFVFWLLGTISKGILGRIGRITVPSRRDAFNLIGRSVQGVLIILGGVMALGRMGVNVNALVAGLGLTGFALGFALKDTLSNFLAGALIMIYHPFQLNDHISVAGFDGIVVGMDLRYTTLQAEGKKILIPNSTLFTNSVTVIRPGK